MTQGNDTPNLSPEDRAAIEAIFGSVPRGSTPPPTSNPSGGGQETLSADELAEILSEIDTLNIPKPLKARYRQAWINYASAVKINDATPPDERSFRGTDKSVSNAFAVLNVVDDDVKAQLKVSGGRTDVQEDEARARAELYRRQAANVGQPTPDKPGEYEARMLGIQKTRQGLMSPTALAYQQLQEYADMLAKDPSTSIEEKQRRLDLYEQNILADLEGTTIAAKNKEKYGREKDILDRADKKRDTQWSTARNLLSDRASTGSNLAQGLFSGLTGAFGRIDSRVNPRYDYNIYDMADAYMDRTYGGPEMTDLARDILRGALGGR